jgi:hypothetical protein
VKEDWKSVGRLPFDQEFRKQEFFMKWKRDSTVLSTLAFILAGSVSCAKDTKHDHAEHDHAAARDHSGGHGEASHHAAEAPVTAQNFADAVKQLRGHMASLDVILKSGDYDGVHKDSVAIGKIGESVGSLASVQGSPVPHDRVKDVTAAGAELAAASRSFHKAAHNDDLATVKERYIRMGALIDSLARHVAQP